MGDCCSKSTTTTNLNRRTSIRLHLRQKNDHLQSTTGDLSKEDSMSKSPVEIKIRLTSSDNINLNLQNNLKDEKSYEDSFKTLASDNLAVAQTTKSISPSISPSKPNSPLKVTKEDALKNTITSLQIPIVKALPEKISPSEPIRQPSIPSKMTTTILSNLKTLPAPSIDPLKLNTVVEASPLSTNENVQSVNIEPESSTNLLVKKKLISGRALPQPPPSMMKRKDGISNTVPLLAPSTMLHKTDSRGRFLPVNTKGKSIKLFNIVPFPELNLKQSSSASVTQKKFLLPVLNKNIAQFRSIKEHISATDSKHKLSITASQLMTNSSSSNSCVSISNSRTNDDSDTRLTNTSEIGTISTRKGAQLPVPRLGTPNADLIKSNQKDQSKKTSLPIPSEHMNESNLDQNKSMKVNTILPKPKTNKTVITHIPPKQLSDEMTNDSGTSLSTPIPIHKSDFRIRKVDSKSDCDSSSSEEELEPLTSQNEKRCKKNAKKSNSVPESKKKSKSIEPITTNNSNRTSKSNSGKYLKPIESPKAIMLARSAKQSRSPANESSPELNNVSSKTKKSNNNTKSSKPTKSSQKNKSSKPTKSSQKNKSSKPRKSCKPKRSRSRKNKSSDYRKSSSKRRKRSRQQSLE